MKKILSLEHLKDTGDDPESESSEIVYMDVDYEKTVDVITGQESPSDSPQQNPGYLPKSSPSDIKAN